MIELAQLIPEVFRRQLLEQNIIYKSIVQAGDTHMSVLVILYQNYLFNEGEPIDMNNPCLACLKKIRDLFVSLLPELVNLEKECNLLEA